MARDFHQTLSTDEKAKVRRLLAALEPFREVRSTMPLQYVVALLLVALDEGEGPTEYAKRAGVSNSVMTRHLLDIGERNRSMEPGFGLVEQEANPMNLSSKMTSLSRKGQALVHKTLRALEK